MSQATTFRSQDATRAPSSPPPQGTLSEGLAGTAAMGIVAGAALLKSVGEPGSPLKDRATSLALGVAATASGVVCGAAAAAAYAAEGILQTLTQDKMQQVREDIELLEKYLRAQKQQCEPLNPMVDKITRLGSKVLPCLKQLEQEMEGAEKAYNAATPALARLKELHASNKHLFDDAKEALEFIAGKLTESRSELGQKSLRCALEFIQTIEKERQRTAALDSQIVLLHESLQEGQAKLQKLCQRTQALSTVECMQFEALQDNAQKYAQQAQLIAQKGGSHEQRDVVSIVVT